MVTSYFYNLFLSVYSVNIQITHRYFDVSWLSRFPDESEILFDGSPLMVTDVMNQEWKKSKYFIPAIHVFENIVHGQFIMEQREEVYKKLLILIQNAIKSQRGKGKVSPDLPSYFLALFMHMIRKMQERNISNLLWLNIDDLKQIKNQKLKKLLEIKGDFWNCFGVNPKDANLPQRYQWKIKGDEYQQLKSHQNGDYIQSNKFIYELYNEEKIIFHLECSGRHLRYSSEIGLSLVLDQVSQEMEGIKMGYDVKYQIATDTLRYTISTESLSQQFRMGDINAFHTFQRNTIQENDSIVWTILLKVFDDNYGRDFSRFSMTISSSSKLQAENSELKLEIRQQKQSLNAKDTEISHLKSLSHEYQQKLEKIREENRVLKASYDDEVVLKINLLNVQKKIKR